jgi:hypothetical protein
MNVTPFVVHFGSLRQKDVFLEFAARSWAELIGQSSESIPGPVNGVELKQAACV